MANNPVCPVCKANLIYYRRSSEVLNIQLKEGCSITIGENTTDTYVDIYCSNDRTHEIGSITSDRVKQIVRSFGF